MLCENFAKHFGAGKYAYMAGMLHDVGKYTEGFQKRILEAGPKVEHSAAGAYEVQKVMRDLRGRMIEFCIAGHHTGLPDGGSLVDTVNDSTLCAKLLRQEKKNNDEYSELLRKINPEKLIPQNKPKLEPVKSPAFSASFFIRMLFSCLVDADFLATEEFMLGKESRPKAGEPLDVLLKKLERHMAGFAQPTTPIDEKRCEIMDACIKAADGDRGVYSLTVPTGGGKTLSSLMFALRHSVHHRMKRVIYVIPYTSIIEQNAGVFRNILGEENVLEHHSQVQYDDKDEDPLQKKKKLAAENWDIPIVVTTNVQFFESLFASHTSKCRKLHNIVDSVIIFDEAQMFPVDFLSPCVQAIAELTANYGVTPVLCTATQPSLNSLFPAKIQIKEICPNTAELYSFFRRSRIEKIGRMSAEELTERLNGEESFLCIVNTRQRASDLYEGIIADNETKFHLSTLMTPYDRKQTLNRIRERLAAKQPCKVISTTLIEAGVDVDFPIVYREMTGLDSIVQAAGRCNREGKRKLDESSVFCFEIDDGKTHSVPDYIKLPLSVSEAVTSDCDDMGSPEIIAAYFRQLHQLIGSGVDQHNIIAKLEKSNFYFPFASIAKEFQIIKNETADVLITEDDQAVKLAQQLRNGQMSRELCRKLTPYLVSVYQWQLNALIDSGSVEQIDEHLAVLIKSEAYTKEKGLSVVKETGTGQFV